jgi:soluble lytic murein transglycosylase-like protein
MTQLLSRIAVLAALLALVLVLTCVVSRSLLKAEAAEADIEAVTAVQATASLPFSPDDHAFIVHYLTGKWGIPVAEATPLATWLLTYSARYNTDPMIQLARVLKESRGHHYRVGAAHTTGNVVRGGSHEIGYSQIMPFWAGKQVEDIVISREMLFDPEGNIQAGIALYKRYERGAGGYMLALARYNRPGSRRPNGYAHGVNAIYQDICSEQSRFAQRQPAAYQLQLANLLSAELAPEEEEEDVIPNLCF